MPLAKLILSASVGANRMMGQLPGEQQRLFYSFNLEDHVPPQHLLLSIDQCLGFSDMRTLTNRGWVTCLGIERSVLCLARRKAHLP
ncbi:hypothetical protein GQA94_14225 [Stutzerimonas stutzeri]|uniref:Transposase n=1 Tax=Stutzerimonas stutzeri TaxID=316 RepID=A0A6I6LXS6_STUST|nr:hypothetical protein GQA94_14225 [Stutzerimonas stutzeri]